MQESKQNELGNFSKLLKRLELENVSMPELRLLKQEHAYLQKLRQQRLKIEDLKVKYDESEATTLLLREENRSQNKLIQEYQTRLSTLEIEFEQQSERKRLFLENNYSRQIQSEKERNGARLESALAEVEQLKAELKDKNIEIYTMEDQYEAKISALKETHLSDRRKLIGDYEDKLKQIGSSSAEQSQENNQLRALVTRQHKALQTQSEQYDQLLETNESLEEEVKAMRERNEGLEGELEQLTEHVEELQESHRQLAESVKEQKTQMDTKDQLESIRKKVSDLTKGEIEKIEFIVNQFD